MGIPYIRGTTVCSFLFILICFLLLVKVSFHFSDLPRIELKSRQTKFWRHQQDKPDTYLATVEAMYYFCLDFHELFCVSDYTGEYDNLLFYFKFMYNTIKHLYDGGKYIKAYMKDNKNELEGKSKTWDNYM